MRPLFLCILAGLCSVAWAETHSATSSQIAQTDPVQLDDRVIKATAAPRGLMSGQELRDVAPSSIDIGSALLSIPGVHAVSRGADAPEPVIRGLGWERVATQVDGLCLYGSCPARMDPPVGLVAPGAAQDVEVALGLPSVTDGPGGTAGRIMISTAIDPQSAQNKSRLEGTWHAGRDGFTAMGDTQLATNNVALRGSVGITDLGDYESGDGRTVPAEHSALTGSVSGGLRPAPNTLLNATWSYQQVDKASFPSLPMDTTDSTAHILTLGYLLAPVHSRIEAVKVNVGGSAVDHLMDNQNKGNRKVMYAESDTEAQTLSGRGSATWRASDGVRIEAGVDARALQRDGTRVREMVAMPGRQMIDRIWPDAWEQTYGLFAESHIALNDSTSLRAGIRADQVSSDADAADAPVTTGPAFGGMSVRDAYVFFYGPEAADTSRDSTLGAGNLLLEWSASPGVLFFGGLGWTSREAGITEKYFAFSPAPGGFSVGNPTLDPELKGEVEMGAELQTDRLVLRAAVFASRVEDYILSVTLAQMDVNGDGVADRVRGFENVDAQLVGTEWSGELALGHGLSVPAELAFVRGRNTTESKDLPEIPPLMGRAGMRYDAEGTHAWSLEAMCRFASKQDRIDEEFGENATAGYGVLDLRVTSQLSSHWSIDAGIENVLDKNYVDHLTREAVVPSGDLKAGDDIPQPGRLAFVSLRSEW